MGQQLVLGIHQSRHDLPIGSTERSLRLLVKAMHAAGVEITEELIHALAIVVEHWPRPYEP